MSAEPLLTLNLKGSAREGRGPGNTISCTQQWQWGGKIVDVRSRRGEQDGKPGAQMPEQDSRRGEVGLFSRHQTKNHATDFEPEGTPAHRSGGNASHIALQSTTHFVRRCIRRSEERRVGKECRS